MNREIIIKLYQYFYQKTYHNPNFEFIPKKGELVTIDKFVEVLNEIGSLGQDWIFHYFAYQFNYWKDLKYKKIKTVIVSYILGVKAFYRYEERNEQSDYFVDEFIRDYKLDSNDIWNDTYYKKDLLNVSKAEEAEKMGYASSRLINCLQHTTLYNIRSEICMLCIKSTLCKKIQKVKYPEVYKLRNAKNIEKISGKIEEEERSLC